MNRPTIDDDAGPLRPAWVVHSQILLDSFRRLLGRDLILRTGSVEDEARRLFQAPFVVVSHDTAVDPLLTYGNRTALALWELEVETLLKMPSRLTAEPVHRDERRRLLERTTRDGYVDDYAGIRISSTGRRFRIERAIVWNLNNPSGHAVGQAATFDRWQMLPVT